MISTTNNTCKVEFEAKSLEEARNNFVETFKPAASARTVMYITLQTSSNLSKYSALERNMLLEWQWVKKSNFYIMSYPLDIDILTFGAMASDKGDRESVIKLKILGNSEACTLDNLTGTVQNLLWKDVFLNDTESYLCNRKQLDNCSKKTFLFYIFMVWVGYDLYCSYNKKHVIYEYVEKEISPMEITFVCILLALYYPLIFSLIEMSPILNKFKKIPDDFDGKQVTEYKQNDFPYGFQRAVLKLCYLSRVEHNQKGKNNERMSKKYVTGIAACRLTTTFFVILLGFSIMRYYLSYDDHKAYDDVYRLGIPFLNSSDQFKENCILYFAALTLGALLLKLCYMPMSSRGIKIGNNTLHTENTLLFNGCHHLHDPNGKYTDSGGSGQIQNGMWCCICTDYESVDNQNDSVNYCCCNITKPISDFRNDRGSQTFRNNNRDLADNSKQEGVVDNTKRVSTSGPKLGSTDDTKRDTADDIKLGPPDDSAPDHTNDTKHGAADDIELGSTDDKIGGTADDTELGSTDDTKRDTAAVPKSVKIDVIVYHQTGVKADVTNRVKTSDTNSIKTGDKKRDNAGDEMRSTAEDENRSSADNIADDMTDDTKVTKGHNTQIYTSNNIKGSTDEKTKPTHNTKRGTPEDTKRGSVDLITLVTDDDTEHGIADDTKRGTADDIKRGPPDDSALDRANDTKHGAVDDTKLGPTDDKKGGTVDDTNLVHARDTAEYNKRGTPDNTKLGPDGDTKGGTANDTKFGTAYDTKGGTADDTKLGKADDNKRDTADNTKLGPDSDTKGGTANDTKLGPAYDTKGGTADDTKLGKANDTKRDTADDNKRGTADKTKLCLDVDTKRGTANDTKLGPAYDTKRGTADDTKLGKADDNKRDTADNTKLGPDSDTKGGTANDTKLGPAYDTKGGTADDTKLGKANDTKRDTADDNKRGTADKTKLCLDVDTKRGTANDTKLGPAYDTKRDTADDNKLGTADNTKLGPDGDTKSGTTYDTKRGTAYNIKDDTADDSKGISVDDTRHGPDDDTKLGMADDTNSSTDNEARRGAVAVTKHGSAGDTKHDMADDAQPDTDYDPKRVNTDDRKQRDDFDDTNRYTREQLKRAIDGNMKYETDDVIMRIPVNDTSTEPGTSVNGKNERSNETIHAMNDDRDTHHYYSFSNQFVDRFVTLVSGKYWKSLWKDSKFCCCTCLCRSGDSKGYCVLQKCICVISMIIFMIVNVLTSLFPFVWLVLYGPYFFSN